MKLRNHKIPPMAFAAAMLCQLGCNNSQPYPTQEPTGPVYEAQGGQQAQDEELMQGEMQGEQGGMQGEQGEQGGMQGEMQAGQGEQRGQGETAEPQSGQSEGQQGMTAALDTAKQDPYGSYLVDANGRALYLFTPDKGQQSSTCYDKCAEAWPPLTTTGDPRAAAPSLNPDMLGVITRKDGTKQVTYGGWPLYYYVKDDAANVVRGQDIHSFGGGWYLIGPKGEKIEATRAAQK